MFVYALYLNYPNEGWTLQGLYKNKKLVEEQEAIDMYVSEWEEKDIRIEKIEVATHRSQIG